MRYRGIGSDDDFAFKRFLRTSAYFGEEMKYNQYENYRTARNRRERNLQKGGRCDWTETVWFPSLAPFPTTMVEEVSESTCWDLQWVVLCLHLYYTDTLPRLICRSRYYNPGLSPTYDIKPVRWLDNFILGLSVYYWECNMSKNYFIIITLKNVIYGQL